MHTGTMKHDNGAIRYAKWNILPLLQGSHALPPSNRIVLICDGHGSPMTHEFLIFCREMSFVLLFRPPYTTAALQGEDRRNFRLLKGGLRVGMRSWRS